MACPAGPVELRLPECCSVCVGPWLLSERQSSICGRLLVYLIASLDSMLVYFIAFFDAMAEVRWALCG